MLQLLFRFTIRARNRQGTTTSGELSLGDLFYTSAERERVLGLIADVDASGLMAGEGGDRRKVAPASAFWKPEPEHWIIWSRIPVAIRAISSARLGSFSSCESRLTFDDKAFRVRS